MKNDKLDFDRNVYLEGYRGSEFYRFISTIVNTQMFEQVRSNEKVEEHPRTRILVLSISNFTTHGKKRRYG